MLIHKHMEKRLIVINVASHSTPWQEKNKNPHSIENKASLPHKFLKKLA